MHEDTLDKNSLEKNMKLAYASRISGLILLAAAASQPATAEENVGWYVGGSVGPSYADIDEPKITGSLLESGFTTTAFDHDDRDTGYQLFAGYQFNRNFAVEGGFFDLGEFGYTATTLPAGTLDGRLEVKGLNLDLLGILPVSDRVSAFGRLGIQYADTEDRFRGTGSVNVFNPAPEETDVNLKAGFGLQYAVSNSLGMRFEVERYRIDDAVGNTGDLDLLSVGLVYRFGQSAAPVRAVSAAPRPEPQPAPIMVVVPATDQYCSILDIQFDINRDVVELEDQEKLGVVGTFMNKYPDTTAVIEGHTDNVGSPARNMELSRERAQHVVNYLANNHGIDRARLSSVGYGETRQLADNRTDAGKRKNRRINAVIACAQDTQGLEPVGARITMALQMEFDTNDAAVRPQYRDELANVARFMRAHPDVKAMVQGHASDQRGTTAKQSMTLSRERADSVVDYLADVLGVDRARLSAEGFGDTRRVAYNTTAEGQKENQRVNVIFTY